MILKIAFAAVAILLQTSSGFACTCAPKRSALDEYEASPVVVIARVASVDRAAKQDPNRGDYGIRSSRLVVERVYKGDVRVGDEILMGQGDGANCQMRFRRKHRPPGFVLFRCPARRHAAVRHLLWQIDECGKSD
jgi:hypothetical protein